MHFNHFLSLHFFIYWLTSYVEGCKYMTILHFNEQSLSQNVGSIMESVLCQRPVARLGIRRLARSLRRSRTSRESISKANKACISQDTNIDTYNLLCFHFVTIAKDRFSFYNIVTRQGFEGATWLCSIFQHCFPNSTSETLQIYL